MQQSQHNAPLPLTDIRQEATSQQGKTKQELWELPLKMFRFVNPQSTMYKTYQPLYEAAYDSIDRMLKSERALDLKKAVFLVENVYYQNKLTYPDFCAKIEEEVTIIRQIIEQEKLDVNSNVVLNYAIQQLYTKPVKYIDKNRQPKTHQPFIYDFHDPGGLDNYSGQFVTKLLGTHKGQCHSLPLLYAILAQELKAKAFIAYSPNHSYIAFPDEEDNYYNFDCTSASFPSYAFIMNSGYVKKEAVKSGIYLHPSALKETIANELTDLGIQHARQFKGIDAFQQKCARQTLACFPNDIMALMCASNYQTAITEAETCYAGWPLMKDIPKNPDLKKAYDARNKLYDYIDDLGYNTMPEKEYEQWLRSLKQDQAKKESEAIKKVILTKLKSNN